MRTMITATTWKVGVALLAILAIGISAYAATGANEPTNNNRRADPAQFRPGERSQEAIAEAEEFTEFPLVWLGPSFEGFELVDVVRVQRPDQDAVYLIYGTCEPLTRQEEPSCVPPVSVVVSAPDSVPPPSETEPRVSGEIGTVRGATSRQLSGSPFIWTGGVVITVHANSEHLDEALAGLRSVNHQALGYSEVKAGEPLVGLGLGP